VATKNVFAVYHVKKWKKKRKKKPQNNSFVECSCISYNVGLHFKVPKTSHKKMLNILLNTCTMGVHCDSY
jgi:hypothetical protein